MNTQGCILGRQNTRRGYQRVKIKGTLVSGHRLVWTRTFGPIPEGMVVRHMCDNPRCINHEHLLLGTHQDNVDDMMKRGRRRCKRPALFTPTQAEAIKERIRQGESMQSVAYSLGCSRSTISEIWHNKGAYGPTNPHQGMV